MQLNIPIIYEDKDILVINNPSGLLVHKYAGFENGKEQTLCDWLLENVYEMKKQN